MSKKGTVVSTLEEICFPVELIDNPNNTNSEYSKVVQGVITKGVPFFSDDEMEMMKESLSDEDLAEMIANNPMNKVEEVKMDLNYCSPRYELVPNSTIFPEVEKILNEQGIEFSVEYSHTDHTRFYAKFVIEDERFAHKMEGTNDVIKFIWNFQHSYNGLTKYKGEMGFFRLVCTNGLVVPVAEMKDYNLVIQGKHTSSILHSLEQFKFILENITKNLDNVKSAITGKYENLRKNKVTNVDERITEVMEAAKLSIVENSKFNTLVDIKHRIESESNLAGLGYDGKVNDWLIYNAINAYIHDDSRNIAAPEKRRDNDSKVLEYMLAY